MDYKDLTYDIHNAVCIFSSLETQYDLDILLDIYETKSGKYFALIEVPALADESLDDAGIRFVDLPNILHVD